MTLWHRDRADDLRGDIRAVGVLGGIAPLEAMRDYRGQHGLQILRKHGAAAGEEAPGLGATDQALTGARGEPELQFRRCAGARGRPRDSA